MKVLVINSDNKMSVKELDNFKDMQKIVNGYIEPVYPSHAYEDKLMNRNNCFIVDEEGLLKNKPINYMGTLLYNGIYNEDNPHPIVGDIIILGYDIEDFRGLTDCEIKFYESKFSNLLNKIDVIVKEESKNV